MEGHDGSIYGMVKAKLVACKNWIKHRLHLMDNDDSTKSIEESVDPESSNVEMLQEEDETMQKQGSDEFIRGGIRGKSLWLLDGKS